MTKSNFIEQAIRGAARLPQVVRSFNGFVFQRRFYFREYDKLLSEEIAQTSDPLARADLQEAQARNAAERQEFEGRYLCSSLREKLLQRADRHDAVGIEKRVLISDERGLLAAEPGAQVKTQVKLAGYAAVYDRLSEDLGGFREKIQPGAFDNAIKKSDVRLLFNHNADLVLARTRSKTLRLYSDKIGLRFYGDLLEGDALTTGVARRIERKDISGCSFAFTVLKDRWELAKNRGDTDLRIIEEIDYLYDVGPVTYPAYPDTSVGVLVEEKSTDAGSSYHFDYDADIEDEFQETMRVQAARKAEIERGYRRAGRIIKWNKLQ